jgi:hypothetical protein
VGDAIARLDADSANSRGKLRRDVEHLVPRQPSQLAVADETQGLLAAAAFHSRYEKRRNRRAT